MDIKHVFTHVNISLGPRMHRIFLKSLLTTYFRLIAEIPKCLQLRQIVSLYHILSEVAIVCCSVCLTHLSYAPVLDPNFRQFKVYGLTFDWPSCRKFFQNVIEKYFYLLLSPCIQTFKSSYGLPSVVTKFIVMSTSKSTAKEKGITVMPFAVNRKTLCQQLM